MNTLFRFTLTSLALFWVGFSYAWAGDTTYTADADLYTTSSNPPSSYKPGTVLNINDRIVVGGGQYGYVHFTVGKEVTSVASIKKAVLRIYLPSDAKNSQNTIEVIVRNFLNGENNWNDGGATPANGAIFTPKLGHADGVIAKVTGTPATSNIYYEWDVTQLLGEKGAGLENNVASFQISVKGGVFRFNDREGHPVDAQPPQLVITTADSTATP